MFKALLKLLMNMAGTIVQLICLPINAIIEATVPDFSSYTSGIVQGIQNAFNGVYWGLNIIPTPVINALILVMTCEIAKHAIYLGAHSLIKVWHVLQKVKFW